jgi:adenylate cyclase
MMGSDESGTLAALKSRRKELIDPKIAEHGGRIVKVMGDGLLVEFSSVVDAVRCATELQQGMATRNADMPEDRRICFRMGVNLGDVIVDGEDLYGDGVNVASRLEGLAEPGGLCISSAVREQLEGKLDIALQDGGRHQVKSIAKGLHIWRWALGVGGFGAVTETAQLSPPSDRPSIAVLPFENMSGDAEQEYFSDGVTEDIITELSRYPDFLVIARNSTFVYKRKSIDLREIAGNLGVQYVLEGSIRKVGKRLRISAQLIDAISGGHVWAERYDRTLDDIFDVQDEITETIVGALGATLQKARLKGAVRKDPSSLDAYDRTLQAWAHFQRYSQEDNRKARRLSKEAIELDPGYARAHAILSRTYLLDFSSHWTDDPDEALERSYEIARKAVSLDSHSFYAYQSLAMSETWLRQHDKAIANFRRALELNPSDSDVHANFGNTFVFAGCAEEAIQELETAMRLNPHYPESYLQFLGRAYFIQRRYQDAEAAFDRAVTINPGWPWAHLILGATRAALGKIEGARTQVLIARKISPKLTLAYASKAWPFKNPTDFEHVVEMLRKAGLPE